MYIKSCIEKHGTYGTYRMNKGFLWYKTWNNYGTQHGTQ